MYMPICMKHCIGLMNIRETHTHIHMYIYIYIFPFRPVAPSNYRVVFASIVQPSIIQYAFSKYQFPLHMQYMLNGVKPHHYFSAKHLFERKDSTFSEIVCFLFCCFTLMEEHTAYMQSCLFST